MSERFAHPSQVVQHLCRRRVVGKLIERSGCITDAEELKPTSAPHLRMTCMHSDLREPGAKVCVFA